MKKSLAALAALFATAAVMVGLTSAPADASTKQPQRAVVYGAPPFAGRGMITALSVSAVPTYNPVTTTSLTPGVCSVSSPWYMQGWPLVRYRSLGTCVLSFYAKGTKDLSAAACAVLDPGVVLRLSCAPSLVWAAGLRRDWSGR